MLFDQYQRRGATLPTMQRSDIHSYTTPSTHRGPPEGAIISLAV